MQGVTDLLFPPGCVICKEVLSSSEMAICRGCFQQIQYIQSPLCSCCGRELSDSASGDHLCGRCLRRRPFFHKARGIAHYQEPVSDLLHRLKYQGDSSVLPALQEITASMVPFLLQPEDRVVVVPLHLKRLRSRGFNQALILARLFFPDHREQILTDVLQRVRHTIPQTELNGAERRKNLRNAFGVKNSRTISGRRLVLIDDVFTTGSTVNECSRVLLAAGAREVSVLTFARVRE